MKKVKLGRGFEHILEVICIYALTTLLAYGLKAYNVTAETLLMVYLLGILIIIMQTKSFVATVLSSILFVFTHDFLFIEPRYSWSIHSHRFIISASVFLIVALIVNTLVIRLQKQVKTSRENAKIHKLLYEASEGLLSVHGRDHVIKYADESLTKLTGCEVEFFFDIPKNDSNEARKWCFKNSSKCGHGETEFPEAGCKYMPIRSKKKTVGVVSIDCTEHELSGEAEDCVAALLSQITIAIEREELEAERKHEAAVHERENIKSMVMKSISHDMYPRITSIHENSMKLIENLNLMEEDEIKERLKEIEHESDYITQTVDNLIDITN